MWWAIGAIWLVAAVLGYGYSRHCWLDYLERHPEDGLFGISHGIRCLMFGLLGPFGFVVAMKKRLTEGRPIKFCFNKKGTT